MALPVFGARRALEEANEALAAGKLDAAAAAFRRYFASRISLLSRTLRPRDAQPAMLAAACALMRADYAELEGVSALLGDARGAEMGRAREWVALLRAAVAGDVDTVFDARALVPRVVADVPALVGEVAAEQGLPSLSARTPPGLEGVMPIVM